MPPQSIEQYRDAFETRTLTRDQFDALLDTACKVDDLQRQLEWFKRQLFGQKSERRLVEPDATQGSLGQAFDTLPTRAGGKKIQVAAHERDRKPAKSANGGEDATPFFDETKVPIEVIEVANPEIDELTVDAYEVVGEKVTHRLAQRPGSYVVLKYVRQVIKRRDTQQLVCAPAPTGVIDGSRADVSFIAGMIVDKFAYHLPLYRQHQRLQAAGFRVSRPWLTQLMQTAVALLEPIHDAQLLGVLADRVKAMDETPIKAGVTGVGKMKTAYFWPIYGERNEICFLYYPDRSAKNVADALGLKPPVGAVLLTDGYAAYAQYARKVGLTHAQCWAHTRRAFFEARDIEPQRAEHALAMIAKLYEVETDIRHRGLADGAKLAQRQQRARPQVQEFLAWVDEQFESQGFLPSSPLTKALAYARERRDGLQVYLDDPDVPIDTNHLERALRAIPMGRKNWMFCWTELGAKHVGMVQSLLTTCKLHDIDPYDYLVDVLQRVGQHPASRVAELTPRRWKELYAASPLHSPLHEINAGRKNAA
jgi:transposase